MEFKEGDILKLIKPRPGLSNTDQQYLLLKYRNEYSDKVNVQGMKDKYTYRGYYAYRFESAITNWKERLED